MMDEVLKEEEAAASRENGSAEPIRMIFEMDRSLDRRRYNAPTCNKVAVVYVGEDGDVPAHREFAQNLSLDGWQGSCSDCSFGEPLFVMDVMLKLLKIVS
ncbi:unnamed protein product [Cylicocyclus nassatus]|uniref:Uncharacterized protein n=1 Tax=Cylicocyclus nassatus TaxID=53992 RepID=A0AA36H648_CYLNA|nr:unnamed protein product [Cylicocyclus nassatus]